MANVSQTAVDFVKGWEGYNPNAYLDSVGVPTIGWGTTSGVQMGQTISQADAEAALARDLAEAADAVDNLVNVPINENQRAALISFAYNVGTTALANSTLLSLLNAGKYTEAAKEFAKWNKGTINGVKTAINGLTNRRGAEEALFNKPDQTWVTENVLGTLGQKDFQTPTSYQGNSQFDQDYVSGILSGLDPTQAAANAMDKAGFDWGNPDWTGATTGSALDVYAPIDSGWSLDPAAASISPEDALAASFASAFGKSADAGQDKAVDTASNSTAPVSWGGLADSLGGLGKSFSDSLAAQEARSGLSIIGEYGLGTALGLNDLAGRFAEAAKEAPNTVATNLGALGTSLGDFATQVGSDFSAAGKGIGNAALGSLSALGGLFGLGASPDETSISVPGYSGQSASQAAYATPYDVPSWGTFNGVTYAPSEMGTFTAPDTGSVHSVATTSIQGQPSYDPVDAAFNGTSEEAGSPSLGFSGWASDPAFAIGFQGVDSPSAAYGESAQPGISYGTTGGVPGTSIGANGAPTSTDLGFGGLGLQSISNDQAQAFVNGITEGLDNYLDPVFGVPQATQAVTQGATKAAAKAPVSAVPAVTKAPAKTTAAGGVSTGGNATSLTPAQQAVLDIASQYGFSPGLGVSTSSYGGVTPGYSGMTSTGKDSLGDGVSSYTDPSGGTHTTVSIGGTDFYSYTPANSTTDSGSGGDGASTVLCTHFNAKGWLPDDLYWASGSFSYAVFDPATIAGYHWWAVPTVSFIRKGGFMARTVETLLWPFVKAWTSEIGFALGMRTKGSKLGRLMRFVGEPVSRLIGNFVTPPNYRVLYLGPANA